MPRRHVSPPSTGSSTPVTYSPSSDARNRTPLAMSRGLPRRGIGIVLRMRPMKLSLSTIFCIVALPVKVKPTTIALERMPYRSEEHTSELQSLMRISYAVFCWKKINHNAIQNHIHSSPHQTTIHTQSH